MLLAHAHALFLTAPQGVHWIRETRARATLEAMQHHHPPGPAGVVNIIDDSGPGEVERLGFTDASSLSSSTCKRLAFLLSPSSLSPEVCTPLAMAVPGKLSPAPSPLIPEAAVNENRCAIRTVRTTKRLMTNVAPARAGEQGPRRIANIFFFIPNKGIS